MHQMNFRCPHCQNNVEVSLETEATVIVMSCAHCKTPLMYYYGEVFEVDQIEMGELQHKQLKAVQGFMKVKGMPSPQGAVTKSEPHLRAGTHQAGQPIRESLIGRDDINDLLIDLETTHDVDEFLRRLS